MHLEYKWSMVDSVMLNYSDVLIMLPTISNHFDKDFHKCVY